MGRIRGFFKDKQGRTRPLTGKRAKQRSRGDYMFSLDRELKEANDEIHHTTCEIDDRAKAIGHYKNILKHEHDVQPNVARDAKARLRELQSEQKEAWQDLDGIRERKKEVLADIKEMRG